MCIKGAPQAADHQDLEGAVWVSMGWRQSQINMREDLVTSHCRHCYLVIRRLFKLYVSLLNDNFPKDSVPLLYKKNNKNKKTQRRFYKLVLFAANRQFLYIAWYLFHSGLSSPCNGSRDNDFWRGGRRADRQTCWIKQVDPHFVFKELALLSLQSQELLCNRRPCSQN